MKLLGVIGVGDNVHRHLLWRRNGNRTAV